MMIRKICSYLDADGNRPVQDFIARLEPKHRQKIAVQLEFLKEQPDALQPPHVKAFRLDRYKGLYELRTRIKQMVRIIFYLADDGTIILLHGFVKKHDRSTEKALEEARVLLRTLVSGGARAEDFTL